MTRMRPGERMICVAYGVESYGGHGRHRESSVQDRLAALLDSVFAEAGLAVHDYQVQEKGDGVLALLPMHGDIQEARLVAGLIRSFEIGLAVINEGMLPAWHIRLRVAVHQGVVEHGAHGYVGPALTEVCRLLEADAVRSVLVASDSFLVVAVADSLYQDVLAYGHYALPGSAFRRVAIKAKRFRGIAWIYLGASQAATPIQRDVSREVSEVFQDNSSSGRGLTIAALGGSVFVGGRPHMEKEARVPIEGEIAALATAGAAAVVAAMGTDAWQGVRDEVIRVFRKARAKHHYDIPGQLDRDASYVTSAADGPQACAVVRQMWEARIVELLTAAPEWKAELGMLAGLGDKSLPFKARQRNSARDSGVVISALLGNVHVHQDHILPSRHDPQGGPEQ